MNAVLRCLLLVILSTHAVAGPRAIVGMVYKPAADFATAPQRPLTVGVLDLSTGTLAIPEQDVDCNWFCPQWGTYGYSAAVAVRNDGRKVYFRAYGGKTGQSGIAEVDAVSGRIERILPIMTSQFLSSDPFRERFVGTDSFSNPRFQRYSTSVFGEVTTSTLPTGPLSWYVSEPVLSPDASEIFVVSQGNLLKLAASDGTTLVQNPVGFQFTPLFDSRRERLYGVRYEGFTASIVVFDSRSLDVVSTMAIPNTDNSIHEMAFDRYGDLLVESEYRSDSRVVSTLGPETGAVKAQTLMAGARFVRDGPRNRLYRIGRGKCAEGDDYACASDVLIEFDSATLVELRRFPMEYRALDDPLRRNTKIYLTWAAFLPEFAQAIEFYNAVRDHYFLTVDTDEIDALDRGTFAGWQRTGESFKVMRSDAGTNGADIPVCRFYGLPEHGLDSHFYTSSPTECSFVEHGYDGAWVKERDDAFYVVRANETTGACPEGTQPVYRLWNARFDSNHRYTTSAAIKAQMISRGYVSEGFGPDGVAFCVRQ